MLDDIRHAFRLMARQRAFTAVAIATLAVGIGATTTIFSIVYGVLLRPLPYRAADRLVRVAEAHPGGTPIVREPMISNVTFHAWRRSARTIDGIGAYTQNAFTLQDRGASSRVRGGSLSPALFEMLGARPIAGRLLREEDTRGPEGPARVVVLSAGFWRERFGGDESIVGKPITLDGQPHLVVGVAEPGFYFPDRSTHLWTPFAVPDTAATDRARIFTALALLRPGMTPEQAAAEGTAVARGVGPRHPSANLLFGAGGPVVVSARLLLDQITADVRPALLVLLAGVALVLLIACANITNLLLSRGVGRGRELAVRAAVGARQGRLTQQLLTETLVLSTFGGALGVALAWLLTRVIPLAAPEDFPRLADIRMDVAALAFAVAASGAAGFLAGVFPAWRLARRGLLTALRDGAGASAGAQTRRLGAGLLVAEAAVAVVLLVGAGLLGRSFVTLLAVDPGYDRSNVLFARVYFTVAEGQTDRPTQLADALLGRIRALPGVAAAGVSNMAPLVSQTAMALVTMRGDSAEPITARALAYVITPGYAEALGLRSREGRLFVEGDVTAGIRPLIVNEAFARTYLNDGRPTVGRRFTTTFGGNATMEIVGVVGNVLKDGLDSAPRPEMYNVPRDAFGFSPGVNLAVRSSTDPLALVALIREAVRAVDSAAAIDEIGTMGSRVSASVSEPRFAMSVFSALAAVALLLAAIGLYGVLSYQVAQRRREMSVRAALGASRRNIVGLVVREGLAVTVAGVVLGLLGAAWLSRLMQGLLFGITPHDAVVFAMAPVALLVVAATATLVPARRAASADPIDALRCE